jgi:uncharacterized protein (DUF362 family)
MSKPDKKNILEGWTRRDCLRGMIQGGIALTGSSWFSGCERQFGNVDTFITKLRDYGADISSAILSGFRELKVDRAEIRGKRILLKPNLVEPHTGTGHINTHPMVVRGAVEAFLRLGASQVTVAEGPGHRRDSLLVLDESGLGKVLLEDRIPFVDLNYESAITVPNAGRYTRLRKLVLPSVLRQSDWIVSMPKMKTHHWAGVTLSMKNLFGVMPGTYYGWPKNVLHWEGIDNCIIDINATVRPHFSIVDGIVGMEGDGPIMGTPHPTGVLVMGRNFPAVDATSARIMGIDPAKVKHLAFASGRLGPIRESSIPQRGEEIKAVRSDFALEEKIHAQKGIRLLDSPIGKNQSPAKDQIGE